MVVKAAIPFSEINPNGIFWGALHPKKVPAWVSLQRLTQDTMALAGLLPNDISCVCGIPRSGMIPASILAAMLHVPLAQLTPNGVEMLGNGNRGFAQSGGRTLIIDDSVYSGYAISRAKDLLGNSRNYVYAAVYVKPPNQPKVDFHACTLDAISHLFEWNFFNNPWILQGGVAFDFDGILCFDPTIPDADDGAEEQAYRQWLLNAQPRWLVRAAPITLIATARLERYRPETETWLARHGIRFERLEMCEQKHFARRGDVAAAKAWHFKESRAAFFVESCPKQAARIHELSGKQVICPDISRVWR